jgi:hypothetical protein
MEVRGPTGGNVRYDLIVGSKLYVLIDRGMRQGDAIPEIRGLEDQRTGTAPRRNVSRVRTGGDRWLPDECRRGDAGYAMEELVAQIGAAFLCTDIGIRP